jgi:hypothetical protein
MSAWRARAEIIWTLWAFPLMSQKRTFIGGGVNRRRNPPACRQTRGRAIDRVLLLATVNACKMIGE